MLRLSNARTEFFTDGKAVKCAFYGPGGLVECLISSDFVTALVGDDLSKEMAWAEIQRNHFDALTGAVERKSAEYSRGPILIEAKDL